MFKQLAKDSLIYGLGDFVFKFVSFAVFPIYTHIFTVADYGRMELVGTLANFIGLFISSGMNNAVQRFYWDPNIKESERPILVSSGFWTLVAWSTLITIITLCGFYFIRNYMDIKYQLSYILILLALLTNVFLQYLQFCMDVLRLHFSPWKFTFLSGMKNFIGVFLGLYLILSLKLGLMGFFYGAFFGAIITVPFGIWLIRKDLRLTFNQLYCKDLIKFGYPFLFAGLAYWLFGTIDRWILGTLSNNTQVGLYSIAFKFATIIYFFNNAFGQAWSPYALKIYSENPDYRLIFSKMFSYWFFGLTIIGMGVILFSTEVLHLLTPTSYWQAASCLGFIIVGVVFQGTTQITVLGISLERKTKILSFIAWQAVILNIILNWVLIKFMGAMGAALVMSITYLFLSASYLYWTQKLHPIPLEAFKLLYSLIVLIISLLFSILLNQINWIWELILLKLLFVLIVLFIGYKINLFPDSIGKNFFKRSTGTL